MISLEDAQHAVLSACVEQPPDQTLRSDAVGCVTAVDVIAPAAVPPFDCCAVDGYAVRAADTSVAPSRLVLVGEGRAGGVVDLGVEHGTALQVMTGAPVPAGADAVVMVEHTTLIDRSVELHSAAHLGDGIRVSGSNLAIGDVAVPRGTLLRAAHIGVLSSLGLKAVIVHPRLRVGVLSTGDELVDDDEQPLQPGQIRDSNREMLLALIHSTGAIPVDLGVVRDNECALSSAFEGAIERCDAVISSGGVSVGAYDYVKVVLDRLGVMRWMQIAIKPGKPFCFGLLGRNADVPVFGLPGNPVASMVTFELLARPALRKMMGHAHVHRPRMVAITDHDLPRKTGDGKTYWERAYAYIAAGGQLHVTSTGRQGSHQLADSATANALIELPDQPGPRRGEGVVAHLLTDL